MNEHQEETLSTQDMVAGAEHRSPERENTPDTGERAAAPGEARPVQDAGAADGAGAVALLASEEVTTFRSRWDSIQTGFVDDPRVSVEQADSLVAQVMKRLAEVFAEERSGLEHQWDRGDQVSTEDLRVAMQRYRTFFDRLLAV